MKKSLGGVELLFLWWPGINPVTSWRCYSFSSHHTRLAFVEVNYLLLGPCLEMCHHWRCWSSAYLREVWSFSILFYPFKHYFCSISAATLLQETHWSVRLQEACCWSINLLWQRDKREHVLWFSTWSILHIGVSCWLSRWLCGFRGAVDVLPALGLPSGLFWCGVVSFIFRSCQFCCSPFGEYLTSWYLFHSCSTF